MTSHEPSLPPQVTGIDEAGRGCLAGPVVAAAVVFPPGLDIAMLLPDLTDSKQCSPSLRRDLAPRIRALSAAWSIGIAWSEEIDALNILNATFRAMSRAASRLKLAGPIPHLAVDGNRVIRAGAWLAVTEKPLPEQTAVISGDSLVPAISAASILAKVFRDALMVAFHRRWPAYAFDEHKGYGTKAHLAAIAAHGPCRLHRKTFRGVRSEQDQYSLF